NDNYQIAEESTLTVAAPGILGNDTDANNDKLSASLVGSVTHGTLALGGNGSSTYTPAAGFSGTDSFTYQASDGQAKGGAATATITVTAINHAPVARNDSAGSTLENTPLTFPGTGGILTND